MKKNFIPILKCELEETGQRKGMIRVWCPFCLKYHKHGSPASLNQPWLGHHLCAHCDMHGGSPFLATGYYVAPDPEKFRKSKRIRVPRSY